jgi:predicted alpha/beta-hydrolase family hydrolase
VPRLIDGPDVVPATVLQQAFHQQVRLEQTEQPGRPLFIGGKSMGGRVASLLVDELAASDGVHGCLCLGYPFQPPGKPLQRRTEHLAAARRWRSTPSRPRSTCTGSPAMTTALSPPAARV